MTGSASMQKLRQPWAAIGPGGRAATGAGQPAERTGHKGTAMLRRYIREGSLFRENGTSAVGL